MGRTRVTWIRTSNQKLTVEAPVALRRPRKPAAIDESDPTAAAVRLQEEDPPTVAGAAVGGKGGGVTQGAVLEIGPEVGPRGVDPEVAAAQGPGPAIEIDSAMEARRFAFEIWTITRTR